MFCQWAYDHEAIRTLNASRSKGIFLFSTRKLALHSPGWVFIREGELFIRRVRKRKITRPVCFLSRTNSSLSMISAREQSISWTFLNDALVISAKEVPKNHTDKERFAAAPSCIETGILALLFPPKRRRSSPSPLTATAF